MVPRCVDWGGERTASEKAIFAEDGDGVDQEKGDVEEVSYQEHLGRRERRCERDIRWGTELFGVD